MKRGLMASLLGITMGLFSGCGDMGDPKVEVVDLNRVLEVLEQVLEEPWQGGAPQGGNGDELQPAAVENPAATQAFLERFAAALNQARLIESPIGVHFLPEGAIEGFVDTNRDMVRNGADEKHLFRVQIDQERSRLIATDESGPYHRDRDYRFRPGGFFMGYMLSSMLSRQNSHYGSGFASKPNFGSMQMSPSNYHSQAVSQAQSRARAASSSSSARSRGGSGSFRFGK